MGDRIMIKIFENFIFKVEDFEAGLLYSMDFIILIKMRLPFDGKFWFVKFFGSWNFGNKKWDKIFGEWTLGKNDHHGLSPHKNIRI